jgi:hypothetical protein
MQEIRTAVREHLEQAYPLVPTALAPYGALDLWRHLEQSYQNEEWRQVFYVLQLPKRTNELPTKLLDHLSRVGELFALYDQLGMRACLEQLTAEEKPIIGECLQAAVHGPFFPDLVGYPHREERQWDRYISVSPRRVYEVYGKFRRLTGMTNNEQAGNAEYGMAAAQ